MRINKRDIISMSIDLNKDKESFNIIVQTGSFCVQYTNATFSFTDNSMEIVSRDKDNPSFIFLTTIH
ncbi:MAG: hypothetical protein IKZ85_08215 [Pseudobutyrivibrio sp.]|nr:hypothetical protein [Pseudobutyrivibrio sp.]